MAQAALRATQREVFTTLASSAGSGTRIAASLRMKSGASLTAGQGAQSLLVDRPASWSVDEVEEIVEAMRDREDCSALQVAEPWPPPSAERRVGTLFPSRARHNESSSRQHDPPARRPHRAELPRHANQEVIKK